jgi:hypothetical protein
MYAGPNNVYVPAFDTQANLIVNYSRDPKKYLVNQIMTITPVSKPIGKYLRIKPEAQGQLTNQWNVSRRWADGAPRPIQLEGGQKHEWLEFFTERYIESFPIGYQTEQNAIWDIVNTQSKALANRMMTGIALEAYTELRNASNYTNTATATVAGGGAWSAATSTNRYIQNSLNYALEKIQQSTMNGVQAEDLVLVLSPSVAKQIAASAEIADYMAGSPFSAPFVQGEAFTNQLGNYGMPPMLYGIKVIVDPLVRDNSALGASTNYEFVANAGVTTGSAYLIARQGALGSEAGGSNFSFLHCFKWTPEEFYTEVIDVPFDKRKVLSVVDNRQVKVVANEAAFLFTAVTPSL